VKSVVEVLLDAVQCPKPAIQAQTFSDSGMSRRNQPALKERRILLLFA